jgi:hypothetical protein
MRGTVRLPRAAALAGFLAAAAVCGGKAKAGTIDFTLQGVTFDDGGTASGTFVVEAGTGMVESVDIATTAGGRLGGTTYTSVSGQPSYFADTPNSFFSQNGNYITLSFQHALTAAGADPIITAIGRFGIGQSFECNNCSTYRTVTGGQAFGVAIDVPEPVSLALLGSSLLSLALMCRSY